MLSKVINIAPVSSKVVQRSPLSYLVRRTVQPLTPPSFKTANIHKYQRYFFANSDGNKDKVSKQSVDKKKTESKNEQERDDEKEKFVEFMQNDAAQPDTNYEYNSKTIFEVASKKEDFTRRYFFYCGMGAIWFGVSYLTFNFINPWVAIIPVWFLAGSLMTIRMSMKFAKTMVNKIELLDNNHVKIYPLSMKGKGVICSIPDTKMVGIKVMSANPQEKIEGIVKSYIIMADFTEAQKKKPYSGMRLIVDPKLTTAPNIDLLKSILHGETEEVSKYKYVEKTQESIKEEQEIKSRAKMEDAEGQAKFEFDEEEFEQLRKELKKEHKEENKPE